MQNLRQPFQFDRWIVRFETFFVYFWTFSVLPNATALFLLFQFSRCINDSCEIINRNVVIFCQSYQMMQRYFVCAAFISCVLLLLYAEYFSDLCLGFIAILTHILKSFIVKHIVSIVFYYFIIQFINCIDFTTHQLYNNIENTRRSKVMKYSLDYIWECIESKKIYASREEAAALREAERAKSLLDDLLSNDQKELFDRYAESVSRLIDVVELEAFVKGVKFATHFIMESLED